MDRFITLSENTPAQINFLQGESAVIAITPNPSGDPTTYAFGIPVYSPVDRKC